MAHLSNSKDTRIIQGGSITLPCKSCLQGFYASDIVQKTTDNHYFHSRCFNCATCKHPFVLPMEQQTEHNLNSSKPLLVEKVHEVKGLPYCVKCYPAACQNRCSQCTKVIKSSMPFMQMKGNSNMYHPECFVCSNENCNTKLSGGYIIKAGKGYCPSCGAK
ncbi:hypothetical protein PROFUN_01531 [Planoprotostelium fungivorum]|uniref:LIM zinc-binding domain-containing protein n=1 Tax=Planoprotostelium fungivorum TaxID=1890364 RepID=A0A2P6NTG3_9EUKA|nr:hypothetical protein PROFUN_01531 [Planoprotostelium fungivorum]